MYVRVFRFPIYTPYPSRLSLNNDDYCFPSFIIPDLLSSEYCFRINSFIFLIISYHSDLDMEMEPCISAY